jgi:hypothetical protein
VIVAAAGGYAAAAAAATRRKALKVKSKDSHEVIVRVFAGVGVNI